jgi:hypothetical protein
MDLQLAWCTLCLQHLQTLLLERQFLLNAFKAIR